MTLARVTTRTTVGIHAQLVTVEVHISNGLPAFGIVGLPETAVKESRDRVRSAIINSHFEFPARKITVNLAPADLPKTGCGFDLPIAIGILCASEQLPADLLATHEFVGELALAGELRGVKGVLPMVMACDKTLIVAKENEQEAAIANKDSILCASHLLSVCNHLAKQSKLPKAQSNTGPTPIASRNDWSDIKSQYYAKRALEIAASGGHNVLMYGPPGSGKTMLAQRMTTILPELSLEKGLECASIASIQGQNFSDYAVLKRPFRAPHHTASPVALVGGGNPPKPGEISLAHNGILFLDELPEFSRHVLETLREPLESGRINISRAARQVEFPANFQLISAMNPCPCGNWGSKTNHCLCSSQQVYRYMSKLSAPLLDRIDIHLQIQAISNEELTSKYAVKSETSQQVKARVSKAQTTQFNRQHHLNAYTSPKQIEKLCQLDDEKIMFLRKAMKKLNLSARSYHRLLRVARTVADMDESPEVTIKHLTESLGFRMHRLN